VVLAVVPNADIHAVLSICGITTEVHSTSIIVNEGFTSLTERTVNTRTKETFLQCKVMAVEGMAVVAEVVVVLEVKVDPAVVAVTVMSVALVDMAMVMAAALRSMVLMS
jgi:hypothetical protein